jgi:hypothetical protein
MGVYVLVVYRLSETSTNQSDVIIRSDQTKLTLFEKNSHFETIPKEKTAIILHLTNESKTCFKYAFDLNL